MIVLDNPIFVKFRRSRLRRAQFLPPAAVVVTLCLLVCYAGYALGLFANGMAFALLIGLQTIVLTMMGAAQIGAAVGGARESGILDFHRVSPLSPLSVTLGFFFGAPVREYLLAAIPIPFLVFAAAMGAPGVLPVLETEAVLLLSAWLLHAASLVGALAAKKPKAGARGMVGLVIFIAVIGGANGVNGLRILAPVLQGEPSIPFFGIPLHWMLFLLLYEAAPMAYCLCASVRKMRSERAHLLSKPQALSCLAIHAALLIGAFWTQAGAPNLTIILVYPMAILAMILTLTMTPTLGEYTKAVRRVERLNVGSMGFWGDSSINRVALTAMCGIVLLGATIVMYGIEGRENALGRALGAAGGAPGLSIAVAVLTVAYVGMAFQFFLLRWPRRGGTYTALFLFGVWLVPLVLGIILAASGGRGGVNPVADVVVSISPIVGIARVGAFSPDDETLIQFAAILPPLIFVALFTNLVGMTRRRALNEVHGARDFAKPPRRSRRGPGLIGERSA